MMQLDELLKNTNQLFYFYYQSMMVAMVMTVEYEAYHSFLDQDVILRLNSVHCVWEVVCGFNPRQSYPTDLIRAVAWISLCL